jgi:hypothetical protein
MRSDRSFEDQFQWEVDRWVFRYRHKGDPVEVTVKERDRLVERHKARMLFGARLLKLGFGVLVILLMVFPKLAMVATILSYAAIILGVPLFSRWAYSDVTSHLRKRVPIGMRLGVVGQITRHAQAQSWLRLLSGVAYLGLISWMTMVGHPDDAFSVSYMLLAAVIGVFLCWMIVVKWAEQTSDRMREEKIEDIRRACELRR